MMSIAEKRRRAAAYMRRRRATPEGRATDALYAQSAQGKARARRYNLGSKAKARIARYLDSQNGKIARWLINSRPDRKLRNRLRTQRRRECGLPESGQINRSRTTIDERSR